MGNNAELKDRNLAIYEAYKNGKPKEVIAKEHGITRSRVSQLIHREQRREKFDQKKADQTVSAICNPDQEEANYQITFRALLDIIDPQRDRDVWIRVMDGNDVLLEGCPKGGLLDIFGEKKVKYIFARSSGVFDVVFVGYKEQEDYDE